MDRGVALVAATAIGGAVALQAPLNAVLGRSAGALGAAVVAFGVGLVALVAAGTVTGMLGDLGHAGDAPLWALLCGGLIGALYVGSLVWTVRALGAGGLTAATIAGQLTVAVLIDHFGWIGVERQPVTLTRLAGIGLLAAGTVLVVRD